MTTTPGPITTAPVICTPLRDALRGTVSAPVIRTGRVRSPHLVFGGPLLVAALAGALTAELRPGDLVVAERLHTIHGVEASPAAPLLYGAVRRLGLRARLGPILSRPGMGHDIRWLAIASGAVAGDCEAGYLARQAPPGQTVALCAVIDPQSFPLNSAGRVALRALDRAAPAVDQWAAAAGRHEILLAAPRSVREIARRCELVLVAGSVNSSNSDRLVEVAQKHGAAAYLVDDITGVDLRWLAGVRRIGVTAGASAPPHLVDELVHCLSGLGPITTGDLRRQHWPASGATASL